MSKPIDQHEGKKYLRWVRSPWGDAIQVDVYAVLEAFGVTCPARQHCIKKLLACGNRSKGSEIDDLIGADAALSRAIELQRQRESQDPKPIPKQEKPRIDHKGDCTRCGRYSTDCICTDLENVEK